MTFISDLKSVIAGFNCTIFPNTHFEGVKVDLVVKMTGQAANLTSFLIRKTTVGYVFVNGIKLLPEKERKSTSDFFLISTFFPHDTNIHAVPESANIIQVSKFTIEARIRIINVKQGLLVNLAEIKTVKQNRLLY